MGIQINGNTDTVTTTTAGGTVKVTPASINATGVSTFSDIRITGGTISGVSTAGITTAYIGSINDGAISGARNRIINGGMDIWQRGTSTTTTGNTYLADRWLSAFTTGGTVSQDTSSVPTGSRYVWKFTSSASNTFMQMGQQIEYVNCLDLQGQTVTISFYAKANNTNSGSTSLIVRTRTGASVDAVVYFSGTNVDTSVTLTTSWVKYTVLRTLPATFGALCLEFVLGSHVSGDGFAISQIQLEPGTVATPFERRSYGQELALAQRYYCKSFNVETAPANGITTGDGEHQIQLVASGDPHIVVYWPVIMRAAPAVTLYNPRSGGASGQWSTNASDGANARSFYATPVKAVIDNSDVSLSATYWRIAWSASAEL